MPVFSNGMRAFLWGLLGGHLDDVEAVGLPSFTVEWSMGGTAHIRAASPEEAKSRAENMPLSDLMKASGDNCDFFEANVDDEGDD